MFGDGADLFIDLLAATSPRKQVKANWNIAKRLYFAHVNGRKLPRAGLLPAHKGNIERALKGEPLSGNKVSAFAANLKGDLSRVTIDIWVLRYFDIDKMSLTNKQYFELETLRGLVGDLTLQFPGRAFGRAIGRSAGSGKHGGDQALHGYSLDLAFIG